MTEAPQEEVYDGGTLPEIEVRATRDPDQDKPQEKLPERSVGVAAITSPGATAARELYIRSTGMSPESVAMIEEVQRLKDSTKPKTLDDCVSDAKGQVFKGKAPDASCKPDVVETLKDEAGNAVSRMVNNALGGTAGRAIGELKDFAVTAADMRHNHQDAIRQLAKENVPGMSYNETQIDGYKVRTWADATGESLYADGKTVSYKDVSGPQGDDADRRNFEGANHKKIEALENQTRSRALESGMDYVGTNGPDALKTRLAEANSTLQEGHTQETAAVNEQRQILQQGARVAMNQSSGP